MAENKTILDNLIYLLIHSFLTSISKHFFCRVITLFVSVHFPPIASLFFRLLRLNSAQIPTKSLCFLSGEKGTQRTVQKTSTRP